MNTRSRMRDALYKREYARGMDDARRHYLAKGMDYMRDYSVFVATFRGKGYSDGYKDAMRKAGRCAL